MNRLLSILLSLLALQTHVLAQSDLPDCAITCSVKAASEAGCMPKCDCLLPCFIPWYVRFYISLLSYAFVYLSSIPCVPALDPLQPSPTSTSYFTAQT